MGLFFIEDPFHLIAISGRGFLGNFTKDSDGLVTRRAGDDLAIDKIRYLAAEKFGGSRQIICDVFNAAFDAAATEKWGYGNKKENGDPVNHIQTFRRIKGVLEYQIEKEAEKRQKLAQEVMNNYFDFSRVREFSI